jgi:hypothetical protein
MKNQTLSIICFIYIVLNISIIFIKQNEESILLFLPILVSFFLGAKSLSLKKRY